MYYRAYDKGNWNMGAASTSRAIEEVLPQKSVRGGKNKKNERRKLYHM